jgi:hypothetical protein
MDVNILEEHAVSIFRVEAGSSEPTRLHGVIHQRLENEFLSPQTSRIIQIELTSPNSGQVLLSCV